MVINLTSKLHSVQYCFKNIYSKESDHETFWFHHRKRKISSSTKSQHFVVMVHVNVCHLILKRYLFQDGLLHNNLQTY